MCPHDISVSIHLRALLPTLAGLACVSEPRGVVKNKDTVRLADGGCSCCCPLPLPPLPRWVLPLVALVRLQFFINHLNILRKSVT